MEKPFFDIVMAATKKGGIGLNQGLPWNLSREMKYFSNLTKFSKLVNKQNVVIMGNKTWKEIGELKKPLPNRINIVISRSLKQSQLNQYNNTYVFNSIDNSLNFLATEKRNIFNRVFFIGGAQLFEQAVSNQLCRIFYLTKIGLDFKCDTYLPSNYLSGFHHLESSKTFSQNQVPFVFTRYINEKYTGSFNPELIQALNQPEFSEKHEEFQYLDLIRDILKNGKEKSDRTGVGTIGKFGNIMRFDLNESFPLLTTKKVFWRGVVEELLWFIKGSTNSKILSDKKVKIWDANGSREFLDKLGFKDRQEGDLGPVYGFQWRHFGAQYKDFNSSYQGQGIDQLNDVIQKIKKDPSNRRIIMSAWNPVDLGKMALPPCHVLSQFFVSEGKLSCLMYQRSCDMGLGVPFNIASYALLTCMIAHICGLQRGEYIHVLGDYHVYKNHIQALQEQVKRVPNPFPILEIKQKVKNIDDFTLQDFNLIGYDPQENIKMEMAV